MKLSVLFRVNAVVATAFGLALALVPAELLALYGITLTPGTTLLARLVGAVYVGLGVLGWLAHAAAPSEARQAIVRARFLQEALGFLVSVYGVLSGASNAFGWSIVAIYGLFAAWFASFAFQKLGGIEAGLKTAVAAR
jgi:hypothetical protein